MQIAASGANFIRKEHVPAEVLRRELDIYRSQAAATGKPSPVVAKIVEGKLGKFYEEVCLYEQSFIKIKRFRFHNSLLPQQAICERKSQFDGSCVLRLEKITLPLLSMRIGEPKEERFRRYRQQAQSPKSREWVRCRQTGFRCRVIVSSRGSGIDTCRYIAQ